MLASSVPLIRVQGLEKSFADVPVLCGVDLAVERGTLVSIIGRSGCGKSTLLRCLNCLELFDRGQVEIAGIILARPASPACPAEEFQQRAHALRGKVVGTLQASLVERRLRAAGSVDLRTYEDEVSAYQDLTLGRLDAVLLDYPTPLYYAAPNPQRAQGGAPIGQLAYGMAMCKGDGELVKQLNAAYDRLVANGTWAAILAKWNLWTPTMADHLQQAAPQGIAPTGYLSYLKATHPQTGLWATVVSYEKFLPRFFWGAIRTLQISLLSMRLAVSAGLLIALMPLSLPKPFPLLSRLDVELIRGTPLLMQLFFIFYALPNLGINLSPLVAAVLGLGLHYAAYESENYRAGIRSVPTGQMEAARALGMTHWQALHYIILPQSLRLVLPPVTNDFISLLKDSSLVSVITLVELT